MIDAESGATGFYKWGEYITNFNSFPVDNLHQCFITIYKINQKIMELSYHIQQGDLAFSQDWDKTKDFLLSKNFDVVVTIDTGDFLNQVDLAGEVVSSEDAELQPGVNSNLLTDEQGLDALSGNAVLNGIPVEVVAA